MQLETVTKDCRTKQLWSAWDVEYRCCRIRLEEFVYVRVLGRVKEIPSFGLCDAHLSRFTRADTTTLCNI